MLLKTEFRPLQSFTLDDVASIVGCPPPGRGGRTPIRAISTDTRTLQAGEIFLALRGENFDGHKFLSQAVAGAAAGLIVDIETAETPECELPILRVPDTLAAYGDLARRLRSTWPGTLVAISGSVGKTTTRRLVAHALGQKREGGAVLEPVKNFNNLIGVPKTLLELEASHKVAVMELGMNLPGELARLTEIVSPDVACLTQIGQAHVGRFASLEELAAAKLSLFETSRADCTLVINLGCSFSREAHRKMRAERNTATFRADGAGEADICVENVRPASDFCIEFDLTVSGSPCAKVRAPLFGVHQAENVAAAAAILHALGEDPELLVRSLETFRGEPLRAEIVRAGDATFILDCYNAPPEAMQGALVSLAEYPWTGRRILVLADMLELGTYTARAHDKLLAPIEKLAPDLILTLGPEMERITRGIGERGPTVARSFERREDLRIALEDALESAHPAGDLVFVKGARGFELEKVARPAIEKLWQS